MRTFATVEEAKRFLVGQIAAEAQREGVTLSDIEIKMLYHSETAWTLSDMEAVNVAFDRDYEQSQYEQKIGALIRNFCKRAASHDLDALGDWNNAVRKIQAEDHYLLVLIDVAKKISGSPSDRIFKLVAVGFGVACLGLLAYLLLK